MRWKNKEQAVETLAQVRYERDLDIHAKRDAGMTQQAIADDVGLSQNRVSEVLSVNPGAPPITDKQKRTRTQVRISPGTSPATAAQRIREKLGDEFADALAS